MNIRVITCVYKFVPLDVSKTKYSHSCCTDCPSSNDRSMSSFLRIFFGLRIHSCSGDMQFHKTQGNHRATPSSTTRKMMSYAFLDIKGTLEIQCCPSLSLCRISKSYCFGLSIIKVLTEIIKIS